MNIHFKYYGGRKARLKAKVPGGYILILLNCKRTICSGFITPRHANVTRISYETKPDPVPNLARYALIQYINWQKQNGIPALEVTSLSFDSYRLPVLYKP